MDKENLLPEQVISMPRIGDTAQILRQLRQRELSKCLSLQKISGQ